MRHAKILGLLIAIMWSLSAFGQIVDPNIGFCNAPVPSGGCPGGDPNPITSSPNFGMWSFGANDANSPWYMLVAIPEMSTTTAPTTPTISGGGFTFTYTAQQQFLSTTGGSIYDLSNFSTQLGGLGHDNSMNWSNMAGFVSAAYNYTPTDFVVFLYTVTPGFNGKTAYTLTFGSTPPNGTFIAGIGQGGNNGNIQFSTPFTTSGFVEGTPPVPDGGVTLMLLGGAFVGLEALRRRFRV